MIRQRFGAGRLARIGAWALAAVTSVAAILNNQGANVETEAVPPPDGSPPLDQFATTAAQLPTPPAAGLLVLRFEPTPPPPPPTIVRRTIIEERVAGAPEAPAPSAGTRQVAPAASPSSGATATPSPPPAPAQLPAAPPVQSSGS